MKKIRLTESQLHNIIKESVRKILTENDESMKMQLQVQKIVSDKLAQMGLQPWGGVDNNNMYRIAVQDNGKVDEDMIMKVIGNLLGADPYVDFSIRRDSNMFGGDKRFIIQLPGYTHTKLFKQ